MITVTFRGTGNTAVKIEGEDIKSVLAQLSAAQDVFSAQDTCKLCTSERIRYQVRTIDGNSFYELLCLDCGATYSFGQHKNGKTLFPKSEPGWHKYQRAEEQQR